MSRIADKHQAGSGLRGPAGETRQPIAVGGREVSAVASLAKAIVRFGERPARELETPGKSAGRKRPNPAAMLRVADADESRI